LELASGQQDQDIDKAWLDGLVKGATDYAKKLLDTEGHLRFRADTRQQAGTPVPPTVVPGTATRISDVNIRLDGPIRQQDDYQQRFAQALEAWALPLGAPYRQEDWEASKRAVLRKAQADRFPKARIVKSEARLDPATNRATLDVTVDSGPLIRFGRIKVNGLQRY
ncbi:outer membrane protein assembly factor, partial [Pseudomonas sp. MWU13-2860]